MSTREALRAARRDLRHAERAADTAYDALRGLRSRSAPSWEIAVAEQRYRDACVAEDDLALVLDRLINEPDTPSREWVLTVRYHASESEAQITADRMRRERPYMTWTGPEEARA